MFIFSEIYVPGQENDDVRFVWEYWDGNSWAVLGDSPRSGNRPNPNAFKDGTFGFRQSGEVSFTVPEKMRALPVNNEEHLWLRARLAAKDFSIGGEYVKDEKDNWVWRFSSKAHSPVFSGIRITFDPGPQIPSRIFSYTNFLWNDLGPAFLAAQEEPPAEVALFDMTRGESPALFLGFREAFPPGDTSLYIKIRDEQVPKAGGREFSFFDRSPGDAAGEERLVRLAWEYWNGTEWISLAVNDYTDSFHESGFVEFAAPAGMGRKKEFGKDLFWLRLRFVSGSFETPPVIRDILLNAVYAKNALSYKNEIPGSGTGAPGQWISPAHGPLLPGPELFVDEGSVPPAKEIEAMKADGISEPYYEDGEAVWVRYKEAPNFYASGSFSRHFVTDYGEGKIYFGDGRQGVNPPRRKFNIRLASYSAGGGAAGNVAAGTLRILPQSLPFVAGCDNPFPAEGGADRETVESLKSRAAGVFKSLQRAVTAEDFEWLSREASASVGRAWCLREKNRRGEICLVIIPVMPPGADHGDKLVPSRELLRRVSAYLDGRKLVGTKTRLQAPVYRTFRILLTLVFGSEVLDSERLKKNITASLREHFHALTGGEGRGWEFGKAVSSGAVLKQLEKTGGIISVDEVALFDADAGVIVEKLVLKDDELPYLADIRVTDRKENL
jgi:uncharacterized phage protein gp47/JayE